MNPYAFSDGTQVIYRAILAVDRYGCLGYGNDLIFKNRADLDFFKEKTLNKVCVMGRLTFESIGRILPNRLTVILTKDIEKTEKLVDSYKIPKNTPRPVVTNDMIGGVLKAAEEYGCPSIWICGGASIYEQYYSYITTWVVTAYTIDVKTEGIEKGLLPKDANLDNLIYIDQQWKSHYGALMEGGLTWHDIPYQYRSYMRTERTMRRIPPEIAAKLRADADIAYDTYHRHH